MGWRDAAAYCNLNGRATTKDGACCAAQGRAVSQPLLLVRTQVTEGHGARVLAGVPCLAATAAHTVATTLNTIHAVCLLDARRPV